MKNFRNPLIFIVEDDPSFQKLIEKTLKSYKYRNIRIFSSGNDCILKINEEKPDVIFMNYEMHGINGHEAMLQIQEIYPDTQFIFLSGQSDISVAIQILKDGAFDYIVKDDAAQENIINRLKKLLYISHLEYEQKTLKAGKKVFIILLLATWAIFMILIVLGIVRL